MKNARSKTANARYAPEHKAQEFPRGKKGIVFCDNCGIVYYKKAWHHNLRHFKSFEKDVPVDFRSCPACQMIKNRQYEGMVRILNVPAKFERELERLIAAYGERARKRDPLHRIIDVNKKGNNFEVTTTENQLAQKLARKIIKTFKASSLKTEHSPHPSDVTFITVSFAKH
jgi:NMD protein affecting ribosome stability and mRNA decay